MARSSLKRLAEIWERTQVELHGQYSIQRVKDLSAYARTVSPWRQSLAYLLTPVPCLVVVALLDCVELEPPEVGAAKSYRTWVRAYLCASVLAITELTQLHAVVPVLPLNTFRILAILAFSSTLAIASLIGLALLIGYPLPFTFPMGCPVWFSSLVAGLWYYCGDAVRGSAEVQKDVKGYLVVVICQMSLTLIYPLYAYTFARLSSYAQTAFVLVLPCIKTGAKNWISFYLGDLDDMKPEFVIFNIEIFNALYVSLCMSNSTSTLTVVSLMLVDFAQAWLSLNDMEGFARDLDSFISKMPARPGQRRRHANILDAAVEILEKDTTISRFNSSVKINARKTLKLSSLASFPTAKVAAATVTSSGTPIGNTGLYSSMVSPIPQVVKPSVETWSSSVPAPSSSEIQHARRQKEKDAAETITKELGLNTEERLLFVQKTTKVLFMIEYAVLIEYTEVVTPLIYCAYILIMFHLPNRAYYPQLVATSTDKLRTNLHHVLLYALLEFASFIAIGVIIKRKFGLSKTHQLTFVLTNQWRMVQSKFALWVMYIVQTYLFHFGADFSFQFKWLSSPPAHE